MDTHAFDAVVAGAGIAGARPAAHLGIQTSPAAGRLAADPTAGRDPGAAGAILPRVDPRRSRA